MERCTCGKAPIFKRSVGGPDLRPEYRFECVCGESGIAGSNKTEAVYRWRRRTQVRAALARVRERSVRGVGVGIGGRSATLTIVDEHAAVAAREFYEQV